MIESSTMVPRDGAPLQHWGECLNLLITVFCTAVMAEPKDEVTRVGSAVTDITIIHLFKRNFSVTLMRLVRSYAGGSIIGLAPPPI